MRVHPIGKPLSPEATEQEVLQHALVHAPTLLDVNAKEVVFISVPNSLSTSQFETLVKGVQDILGRPVVALPVGVQFLRLEPVSQEEAQAALGGLKC